MQSFIVSFSIIIVSLLSGYAFNVLIVRGLVPLTPEKTARIRLNMQKTSLLGIYPVAFLGAIWIADLSEPLYFLLPFIGIAALATGLVYGLTVSRLLHLPPARGGVFATSASFTNLGAIGALVVFMLLGEPGFALMPFYKLLEELWNYSILFPIARAYGDKANLTSGALEGTSFRAGLSRVLRDPFLLVSFSAVSLGLVMNFTGAERPDFYTSLNKFLVPAGTTLLLFAIGMRIRFTVARQDLRPSLLMVLGKSVVIPVIMSAIALALGLGQTADGLGLKLVFVMAAMPVAFVSLVPPALYKLDQDLAGSLWLVSNAALLIIVPALALILRL
jgi:predicted permease